MPSSSTRSTLVELTLLHYYRIACARLYFSRGTHDANIVTNQFADLLDIDPSDLVSLLHPRWNMDYSKHWQELEQSSARMRRSEMICGAGNALSDAAAVLSKAGRSAEATRLSNDASVLWGISLQECEREDWFNHSGGSGGSIDLDMK